MCSFLMNENSFHCGVDIQHPWFVEQALPSLLQMLTLPLTSFNLIELFEIAAGAIFNDDFFYAQHRGVECVKSQHVGMNIARVTTQNRKCQRTEHILMSWSIRACESKWRLFANPPISHRRAGTVQRTPIAQEELLDLENSNPRDFDLLFGADKLQVKIMDVLFRIQSTHLRAN